VSKFQHNDFAIKTQEGGLPDFFNGRVVTRMARTPIIAGLQESPGRRREEVNDPLWMHGKMRPQQRSLRNRQGQTRESPMRSFLLLAAAFVAFAATMTFEATDANAVVCARGVVRAGCAGARGAAVVRRPVAVVCRTVVVNGVKVRRCG
jgi:hypothetical protein